MKKSTDRRWLPLNALRAFEGVARHGSFTSAAQALLISQSSLSQHVISLERQIGVRLFERRPQGATLTEAGRHLVTAVTTSLDRLECAIEDIRDEGAPAQRILRVRMPLSFAVHLATPILRDFRRQSADIDVDLSSSFGADEPLADADVAVVAEHPSSGDFVADLLWPVRLRILCHPQVAERGHGKDLGAFIDANEIVHVRHDGALRHEAWCHFAQRNGVGAGAVRRGLVFDSAVLAVQYLSSGQGIALADPRLFTDDIRAGRLVSPFAAELDTGHAYYLVTHPEGLSDAAVAMFRSWLIERFEREWQAEQSAVPTDALNEDGWSGLEKSGTN